MIKRAEEMITEIKEQMRGGKGKVTVTHLFEPEEINGKARLIAQLTLEPGCSVGFHEHVGEEEIFYVISGVATVIDEGEDKVLQTGDAALTRGGQSHSLRNDGNETAKVMAIILLYC
jgi:quercetin dioxygenase-like cupin family protein